MGPFLVPGPVYAKKPPITLQPVTTNYRGLNDHNIHILVDNAVFIYIHFAD